MARLCVVFTALMCILAASVHARMILRIVGGKKADLKHVAYQVSIVYNGEHFCGGSIINKRTIVTAAHCLSSVRPKYLKIRMGTTNRGGSGGVIFSVVDAKVHPKFNAKTMNYDIAILRTRSDMDVGQLVQAVDLPEFKAPLPVGKPGVISGWGFTSRENGQMSDDLLTASVPVIDDKKCKSLHGDLITESMFCAGDLKGGVDACKYDSGGPFVVNKKLVGVISWGTSGNCGAPNEPGVYTNVALCRDWLDTVANDYD